ncbi:NAD-dependent protein deacetylase 3, partial [Clarias magur]
SFFVWTQVFPVYQCGLDCPQCPHCTEQATTANRATGCLYEQCLKLLENQYGHQLFTNCFSIDHLKETVSDSDIHSDNSRADSVMMSVQTQYNTTQHAWLAILSLGAEVNLAQSPQSKKAVGCKHPGPVTTGEH